MSRAASKSIVVTVMPSVCTSSMVTRELNAMDARMAIFAARVEPVHVGGGPASAKPFSCASLSAAS